VAEARDPRLMGSPSRAGGPAAGSPRRRTLGSCCREFIRPAFSKLPSAPRDFAARIQDVVSPGARPTVAELRAQSRGLADLARETRALVADP